jgi:hypothetical protein
MNKKIYLVSFITFSLVMISSYLYAKPAIQWNPEKLNIEQAQGTVSTHSVSIDVSKNAQDVLVRVVPELQKWISVSPTEIGNIQKGQNLKLDIIVNLPLDASIGEFDGVVQLKEATLGKPTKNISKPLPMILTVKKWENNGLPPDPGEAGKQDLLGIDSNNDGVRDDVEIAIAHRYPSNENLRLALKQFSKSIQLAFNSIKLADDTQLNDSLLKIVSATDCITGASQRPQEDIIFIENIMQNTQERVDAYLKANDVAAGQVFGGEYIDFEHSCER